MIGTRCLKPFGNAARNLFFFLLLFPLPVSAEDGDSALSIVQAAASSNSAAPKVFAIGKQIEQLFGSVYNLLVTVGVCLALIGMILSFVEIGLSRNGCLRDRAKWKLVGIAGALILIGGATAIVNLFLRLI